MVGREGKANTPMSEGASKPTTGGGGNFPGKSSTKNCPEKQTEKSETFRLLSIKNTSGKKKKHPKQPKKGGGKKFRTTNRIGAAGKKQSVRGVNPSGMGGNR